MTEMNSELCSFRKWAEKNFGNHCNKIIQNKKLFTTSKIMPLEGDHNFNKLSNIFHFNVNFNVKFISSILMLNIIVCNMIKKWLFIY